MTRMVVSVFALVLIAVAPASAALNPQPNIMSPASDSYIYGIVTVEEIDESGEQDIVYNLFDYYFDENCNGTTDDDNAWHIIGNDTNGSDGWSIDWNTTDVFDGCYMIRATMGDWEGLNGTDIIQVYVNNTLPEPYILDPVVDHLLYTAASIPVIYKNHTEIQVADLNLAEDINHTIFEYSNGTDWHLIGMDYYGGFEDGSHGWNVNWSLSGLAEGVYYIRTTMVDFAGDNGSDQIEVHYDPTPPLTTLYQPVYLQEINGTVAFSANTSDEDTSWMRLSLFIGSNNSYTQKGTFGNADQHDVGKNASNGVNYYCAPTAAANGLWRIPALRDDFDNATALGKHLIDPMKTKESSGTEPKMVRKGIANYLAEKNLGCKNPDGYKTTSESSFTFKKYDRYLRQNEVVLIGLQAESGRKHFLTGKDSKSKERTISVIDPMNGQDNSLTQIDGKFVTYNGARWKVIYLLVISPKKETNKTEMISEDTCETGDCTVYWDTTTISDGFYVTKVEINDSMRHIGANSTVVYVNNNPPMPEIITPPDGSEVGMEAEIVAEDTAGSEDIANCSFEYSADEYESEWFEIGTDTDDSDGLSIVWDTTSVPNGEYFIRATTTDFGGMDDSNTIEVIVSRPKVPAITPIGFLLVLLSLLGLAVIVTRKMYKR